MNRRKVVMPALRLLRIMSLVVTLSFLATFSTLAPIAVHAQPASTLVVGLSNGVTSLDLYFHNVTPSSNVVEHMSEVLIAKDGKMRLKPGPAVSWKALNDTAQEVELRPGMCFHDSSESASADVMYSLVYPATIKNGSSLFTIYMRGFEGVTVLDKLTVRITANDPYPLVPNDLSTIYMVLRKAVEKTGVDDFNNGRVMIGIGPYKFASFTRDDRLGLTRFDGYWGKKPQWQHVTLRTLTVDAPRVAALLAGDVQVIENVPGSDIKKLSADPAVLAFKMPVSHVMHPHIDSNRDVSPFVTDKAGKPLSKDPPKDVRVRKTTSLTISYQAIVNHVMEGATEPTGQLVNDMLLDYVPGLEVPVVDLSAAKKLLTQVGCPDDFVVTLHATSNRYLNDDRVTQVITSTFPRVSTATKAETLPSALLFTRANKLDFSFPQVDQGADTGEASSSLKALLTTFDPAHGRGASSCGHYSSLVFGAKLVEALQALDDNECERLLQEAAEIGIRDGNVIPLYFNISV